MINNANKPMKTRLLIQRWTLAALLPVAALAQTDAQTAPTRTNEADFESFTPQAGTREFSVGGSGATNKDFNNSFGGASFAFGTYLNPATEVLLRQTINYDNPSTPNTSASWNGSTKIALDQHVLAHGKWRPFVGVNAGRIYGESVRDTWSAGLETGVKYYVQPRTFISATVEYGWLFQHARGVEDRFDDGQWNWSLGVGFNF